MQKIQFDYFHGIEADQYSFYRIPKVLFTAGCFSSVSCEAKVLYGLMLDRMSLSVRNRWFDEEDRVYIVFKIEEVMELMHCGTQKAVRLMKELDTDSGIGLIEKKRLGLGRPNVIYVKNFMIREGVDQDMAGLPADSGDGSLERQFAEAGEGSIENQPEEAGEGGMEKRPEEAGGGSMEKQPAEAGDDSMEKQAVEAADGSMEGQEEGIKDQVDGDGALQDPVTEVQGTVILHKETRRESGDAGSQGLESTPGKAAGQAGGQGGNSRILKIKTPEFPKPESIGSESQEQGVSAGKKAGFPEKKALCFENQHCRVLKIKDQEFRKQKPNNTDYSNTELNDTDLIEPDHINPSCALALPSDVMEEMELYREMIRDKVSYGHFIAARSHLKGEVDELIELVVDVMMMPDNGTLRIAGVERPVAVVKNRFMKLEQPHFEYVTGCLRKNTAKVENIKAYLLTVLYNATMTMDNYYRAEVNHDMYGAG